MRKSKVYKTTEEKLDIVMQILVDTLSGVRNRELTVEGITNRTKKAVRELNALARAITVKQTPVAEANEFAPQIGETGQHPSGLAE